MAVVGSLIVSIGSDISGLTKGLKSAETSLGKVGRVATNAGAVIAKALAAAGAATLGMAIAGIKLGDALGDSAKKIGTTAEALGSLRHAASLSGVGAESLDKSLQRLGRTVSEAAHGSDSATRSLSELGLRASDLQKLPLDQQFLKITTAMSGTTSATDKLRLSQELFGRSGADLIPLLNESAESIQAMQFEAKQLGLTLDETQARMSGEASDALDTMAGAVKGLSLQLGSTFAPAIEAAAKAITSIVSAVTNALPAFSAWADRILGIRRAMDDLSDAQARAESQSNFKELIEQQERLQQLEAARGDFMFSSGRADLEKRIAENLASQADLRARNLQLLDEMITRQKEQAALELSPEGGGAGLLQTIEVTAQKIEVERSFSEVLAAIRRARLDDEITVNASHIEVMRNMNELRLQSEQELQRQLNKAVEDGTYTRDQFEQASFKGKLQGFLSMASKMTAGVAQHNEKLFELNKKLALAQAAVALPAAVLESFRNSGGWPWGAVAAAAMAATGVAQIQAIKRTQFQGGGQGTTPSLAGSTGTVNSQPAGQQSQPVQRTMVLQGISPEQMFSGRQMRNLAERLSEFLKDGGKIVFA